MRLNFGNLIALDFGGPKAHSHGVVAYLDGEEPGNRAATH